MLMWQLRRATARFHRQNENIFKNGEHDAVTSFLKTLFHFFPWKMKRSARVRVANKHNHKVNYTHIHCVYVCWWGVSDPNNVFVIFFQHEIHHVPLVFLGNRFLKHRTVAWRIRGPFQHLIMGTANAVSAESRSSCQISGKMRIHRATSIAGNSIYMHKLWMPPP